MNNFPPTTRREPFTNGLTVRVDERGSGRPILVLHSAGGPQEAFTKIVPDPDFTPGTTR